jgi:hypothetical protein
LSLSIRATVALFALLLLLDSSLRAEELNVFFKSTPRLELLRPFSDPADMSVLVTGADGRPVAQGAVRIRLDAPEPGRFFSTDFPMVEGTRLLDISLNLRQGRANWKSLLPIRGDYRLIVDAATGDGRKASKRFSFTIHERGEKWLALGGFSLALFVLGFVAGRIFTGVAKRAVALLVLGSFMYPGGLAKTAGAVSPSALLEIEPASVGRLTLVRWRAQNRDLAGQPNTLLTLTITHLEKEKIAFAIERVPVAGEFSFGFHFTDGARYQVSAVAEMAGALPIRNDQVVEAAPIEPPFKAMLPALTLFIGTIALGLACGRWTKLRG